jgi:adenine-specific DNA-methyltransferase
MLAEIDKTRLRISAGTEAKKKSRLGQFLTPSSTARFMANLFAKSPFPACRLLDPGAGIGSLSGAFLERWVAGKFDFASLELTAFEIDPELREALAETLSNYQGKKPFTHAVIPGDFIEEAVNRLQFGVAGQFTHAIINPPYKKINTGSRHRLLLRQVGIETVNLYTAFVALSLALLRPGGQLVAIIPRSFCNGPYYRPFREFLLERAAIRHMHLFASRDKAFQDDAVLQENIIILLERNAKQQDVMISTSTDHGFSDYSEQQHAFDRIVRPDDPDRFIHVPTSFGRSSIELSGAIRYTLDEIGLMVSTGPVVDFRLKEHLRQMPEAGTVPLLYSGHFSGKTVQWPKENLKKPNAILRNADTEKWLYPSGHYCVTRRFSSKEERRRIVASVVDPVAFTGASTLGFENHLNVFHQFKQGIPEALAHGLTVFLNTTAVDEHFRRFNGHTQVNATDLRSMRYPSRDSLIALGKWAMENGELSQDMIDEKFSGLSA